MRNRLKMSLPALLCAFAALFSSCSPEVRQSPELLKPVTELSDITPVMRGEVKQWGQIEGTVTPYTEALNFMATDAPLLAVYVLPGQDVKEGDLLAELDTEKYLEGLDALKETLAHSERAWAHENMLAQASLELASLESTGTYHELELKRYRVNEMLRGLELQRDLQALERERLLVRISEMEEIREGYYIKAPFDGTVMHVEDIYPGDTPVQRAPVIFLADMSRVTVNCPGDSSKSFRSSDSVVAVVEGREYPVEEIPYSGEEYLSYYFAGTIPPVRFSLGGEDAALSPDQYVRIRAEGKSSADTLWLPVNAIREEGGEYYVYVYENGARVRRNIRVGLESETRAEIIEGLAEGEMVYVD